MFNRKLKAELEQALTNLADSLHLVAFWRTEYHKIYSKGLSNANRLASLRAERDDLQITIEAQKEQREAVESKLADALAVTAQLRCDNEELRRRNAALVDIALRANERLKQFWLGVAMSAQRN